MAVDKLRVHGSEVGYPITADYESNDASKLTRSEARDMAAAHQKRNLTDCRDGMGPCDRSTLTPSERKEVNTSIRQLNASNCETGTGLCDHSRRLVSNFDQTLFKVGDYDHSCTSRLTSV